MTYARVFHKSVSVFIDEPSQNPILVWGCRLARFCQCKALLQKSVDKVFSM